MKISEFLKAVKFPLYGASILPPLIAASAVKTGINYYLIILMIIIMVLLQLTINLTMDYFDFLENRTVKNFDTLFPLGPVLIEKFHIIPKKILIIAGTSLIISIILGVILNFIVGGYVILLLGFVGIVAALIYILPPFKLGPKGIGEPITFLAFGPLSINGAYFAVTHNFSQILFLISIYIGLLISAVRYIHHISEDGTFSIRFKYFSIIYPILLFGGFVAILMTGDLKLLLFTLPAILVSIAHFLKLPENIIKVSRKTNEMSIIHLLASIMIILYFIF